MKEPMDVDTIRGSSEAASLASCELRLRAFEAEVATLNTTLAASRKTEGEALKLIAAAQAAVEQHQKQEEMIQQLTLVRDHLESQLRDQGVRASDMMFKYHEMDDKDPPLISHPLTTY